MIASEIPRTITQFVEKDNPYQCILIDGPWGIGKSFQIDKALKAIPYSATTSLFGAKSVDEVLLQLAVQICDNSKTNTDCERKIKKTSMRTLLKLPTILGEVDLGTISAVGRLIGHALTPQTVLDKIFSIYNGKQPFLVVFDDIERINDNNIDLDIFLGTVETLLLKRKNIKVLFIANFKQLSEKSRELWDRFSEKLINRVYFVDELSEDIEFFPNQADNDMALSFMRQHGCKNLRTLKKANDFFADILYRFKSEDTQLCQKDDVLKSLQLACYAVVFEHTEKIYELKYQQWEKKEQNHDNYNSVTYKIFNRDEIIRICYNYLFDDSLAAEFVPPIIKYLKKGHFVFEDFVSAFNKFISNDKPTYYKSDEEVLRHIEELRSSLISQQYTGMPDLVKKVDEVFIWCEVMQVDADDLEKLLYDELPNEYRKLIDQKGKLDFFPSSICYDSAESNRMKKLLKEFAKKESMIYVDVLICRAQSALEKNDFSKVLHIINEIDSVLQNKQNRCEGVGFKGFATFLCSEQLLPIGSISETQYYCCKDAYMLGMTYFHEVYSHFIQEQEEKHISNKMFSNRMKHIKQEYDKAQEKG